MKSIQGSLDNTINKALVAGVVKDVKSTNKLQREAMMHQIESSQSNLADREKQRQSENKSGMKLPDDVGSGTFIKDGRVLTSVSTPFDKSVIEEANMNVLNEENIQRTQKEQVNERKEMLKNNPKEFKEKQIAMRMNNKNNSLNIPGQKSDTSKQEVKKKEEITDKDIHGILDSYRGDVFHGKINDKNIGDFIKEIGMTSSKDKETFNRMVDSYIKVNSENKDNYLKDMKQKLSAKEYKEAEKMASFYGLNEQTIQKLSKMVNNYDFKDGDDE